MVIYPSVYTVNGLKLDWVQGSELEGSALVGPIGLNSHKLEYQIGQAVKGIARMKV